MRAAGLTIHPEKVQLAAENIDLLGFVVDKGVVRPNPDKLQAILQYPPPRYVKRLQRFIGMVAFYQQFVPQCASISLPLNQLLRKSTKWCWATEQQMAFESLLTALAENASLQLPHLNKPFVVQTDASEFGLGAVLLQEWDKILRPLAFASHTLTSAERNYSVPEKECLAIVLALKNS